MKHFRISSQALSDLDEIWLFIAEDDIEAADHFHDVLLSKFILIAKQPLIGRPRDDLQAEVRSLAVGNYIIFYRDTPHVVEIIRVLHGARDIENLF